jgi:hypothetical protein
VVAMVAIVDEDENPRAQVLLVVAQEEAFLVFFFLPFGVFDQLIHRLLDLTALGPFYDLSQK